MRQAESVTFGGSALDRAADLRADQTALDRALAHPDSRVIPLWRGKPLVAGAARDRLGWVCLDHPVLTLAAERSVLLGREDTGVRMAIDISGWEPSGVDAAAVAAFFDPSEQHHPSLPLDHRFAELRGVMTGLDARDAEYAATARSVLGWHQTHRFCARCGHPSEVAMAGWQRLCSECGAHHFPRTDPVVIMLVTHGNSVLVGRSPGWPEGMYSLLAGFIDAGETIEAAVRREVAEESGIQIGRVDYLASQPWPFPSSLMIGCRAHATSRDIRIDPAELEDALWLSREDMVRVMAGAHPRVKPARRGAIAHFLMRAWLADRLD